MSCVAPPTKQSALKSIPSRALKSLAQRSCKVRTTNTRVSKVISVFFWGCLSACLTSSPIIAKPVPCKNNIELSPGHSNIQFSYWPVSDQNGNPYGRAYVSQDYAQYWHHSLNGLDQHHTAFDIAPGVNNARAVAVADGYVVALIPNDRSGCTSGCTDHGFGNTLILKSSESSHLYTLYAHLASFDQTIWNAVTAKCKPLTKTKYYVTRDEYTCHSYAVPVTATQVLGIVGATCSGQNDCGGGINLHFEVRKFTDLVSHKADVENGDGFGYSKCYPNEDGYRDPSNFFDEVSHIEVAPFQVTVTHDGDGVGLHFGPNQEYPRPLSAFEGASYWVPRRKADPTTNCSHGWDEITQQQTSDWPGDPAHYFYIYTDGDNVKNYSPGLWICKGNKDQSGDHDYVEPQD